MALSAREWLLLARDEQEARKTELSSTECFKLRMELSMIHFSEDEKKNMSEQEKEKFIHPKRYTAQERKDFSNQCKEIFRQMAEDAKNDTASQK